MYGTRKKRNGPKEGPRCGVITPSLYLKERAQHGQLYGRLEGQDDMRRPIISPAFGLGEWERVDPGWTSRAKKEILPKPPAGDCSATPFRRQSGDEEMVEPCKTSFETRRSVPRLKEGQDLR